jgi:hypothetical protein
MKEREREREREKERVIKRSKIFFSDRTAYLRMCLIAFEGCSEAR